MEMKVKNIDSLDFIQRLFVAEFLPDYATGRKVDDSFSYPGRRDYLARGFGTCRPFLMQRLSVLLQTHNIGTGADNREDIQQLPERFAMIFYFGVNKFMQYHIINKVIRQSH